MSASCWPCWEREWCCTTNLRNLGARHRRRMRCPSVSPVQLRLADRIQEVRRANEDVHVRNRRQTQRVIAEIVLIKYIHHGFGVYDNLLLNLLCDKYN